MSGVPDSENSFSHCVLILALLDSACALAYHRFSFIWSLISSSVWPAGMSVISEVGKSLSMCVKKTLNRCQLSFRRSVARDRFLSTVTYSIMSFECSPRYSHSPSFLIFICIPCFGCLLTWAGRLRVIKCRCFFFCRSFIFSSSPSHFGDCAVWPLYVTVLYRKRFPRAFCDHGLDSGLAD